MLLEQLFEEVGRCLDEIEMSKHRICDVVSNTNDLCVQHGILHEEVKKLRKDVVNGCLELKETEAKARDISRSLLSLSSSLAELQSSLEAKSHLVGEKKLDLEALNNKLDASSSSLNDEQIGLNTNLLKLDEVEQDGFKINEASSIVKTQIENLKVKMAERRQSYDQKIQQMQRDMDSMRTEISSVKCNIISGEKELLEHNESIAALEKSNHDLMNNLSNHEKEKSLISEDMTYVTNAISLCRKRLEECGNFIRETEEATSLCSLIISNLEEEESSLLRQQELASSRLSEFQDTLAASLAKIQHIDHALTSVSHQELKFKDEMRNLSRSHSQLESSAKALKCLISESKALLSKTATLSSAIEILKSQISELSRQHSCLMDESASCSSKTEPLKNELEKLKAELRKQQEVKMGLMNGITSENSKSSLLTKDVEQLNKEITQATLLLSELTKKYDADQAERDNKLGELKQHHLNEYKEKQSVKICDIKAELKKQREAVLQEKRIQCSRSLDECTAKLRSGFSDLVKDHQRKLNDSANVISQLQEESRKLATDTND